jgi:YggT family protein
MGFISYFLWSLLNLLEFFLIVRCVLSWLPDLQRSQIASFIYMMTDPLVMPFQALLQNFNFSRTIPIDFSPIFAFMVLQALQNQIC